MNAANFGLVIHKQNHGEAGILLCEKTPFQKVQMVAIPPNEEENFVFKVTVKHIDEGKMNLLNKTI